MKPVRFPVLPVAAALVAALALGRLARTSPAAEGLWLTDFNAAQAKAKEEKKYLLVDFTGSDWCTWCIKLHKEVFDKEFFKNEAPKRFVLVELDFPQDDSKITPELKKQNERLRDKYDVKDFPAVLLINAEGQVVARTSYEEGGAENYLKHLAEFPRIYAQLLALKDKLDKTRGLDRAKLLDEIVEDAKKLGDESDEVTAWSKEIVALDAGNKAGLKVKYEFPLGLDEVQKLLQADKIAAAKERLEKALALKGVPGELRQNGYRMKSEILFSEKKFADAADALKLAKETAPETPLAKQLDTPIVQLRQAAEAQEETDKLQAGLDKAEGIERAKLLDKLIDAQQRLVRFDPEAAENIKKWTREIISLDGDNKAGLKKKHRFRAVLSDADELFQAGKADEANLALDKALDTTDIPGEDVQAAHLLKARIAFGQHRSEEGVKHLKLALDAAPTGRNSGFIKMMLAQSGHLRKPAPKKPENSQPPAKP